MTDNFSMEKVFDIVGKNLPGKYRLINYTCPYPSKGFWGRLGNIISAPFHQGDINHITGDVNYIALLLSKKRTILTIHDCGFLYRKHSALERWLFKYLWYQWPIAKSQIVTAVSEKTKKDLLSFIKCDPKKIRVIPNPVSSIFARSSKNFSKRPTILQVGTAPNKNLKKLIAAIAPIRCHLLVLGHLRESDLNALKKYKISYENVFDLTEREVLDCYKRADLLTFVSRAEGFGIPIIEANIVGRPVVTSNLSPMKEVAGNAALLVNPNSVGEIREAVLALINNPKLRTELVKAGERNARRFDAKNLVREYSRLYEEIVT